MSLIQYTSMTQKILHRSIRLINYSKSYVPSELDIS
jgi:hypothetical protein